MLLILSRRHSPPHINYSLCTYVRILRAEQELAEVVREFSADGGGGNGKPGSRGENKVLYDDFVDMLVVGSPR